MQATVEETRSTGGERLPLCGVRVVDFGWVWAGAVPGHLLADLGAEVIKVETHKHLDYMRQGRPIVGDTPDPEQNPMFHNVNRGKLSITVDIRDPRGAELIRKLVALSDVVIENFSPGILRAAGLDHASLRQVKPDLVMISMSAAGQYGPLKDIRTYATMIAGLSGLDSMVGYPGEGILGMQQAYADPNASLHAAVAVLAALVHRRATGEGQYIDLSQWEAGVAVVGEYVLDHSMNRRVARPQGNRLPGMVPHGHYPCQDDRWVSIAVTSEDDWRAFCGVLGNPSWTRQDRFADVFGRCEHQDALDRHVAEWTRERTHYEVTELLQAAGVAAAPLLDASERFFDPHFQERGTYVDVEHPILGAEILYGVPWRMSETQLSIRQRAPFLGEHNQYVFGDLLGLPTEEIARLVEDEVLY